MEAAEETGRQKITGKMLKRQADGGLSGRLPKRQTEDYQEDC